MGQGLFKIEDSAGHLTWQGIDNEKEDYSYNKRFSS